MPKCFRQMALQSQIYRHIRLLCSFLVQEVDAGPPESKITDLTFELEASRSKIYLHKTANL